MGINVALPTWKLSIQYGATNTDVSLTQFTSGNYTVVADVRDISGPSISRATIDVSHFDSPDNWREFIYGMNDGGDISFEINWNPANTTHGTSGIFGQLSETVPRNWAMKMHPGQGVATTVTSQVALFKASVSGFDGSGVLDDAMRATITLKVASDINWTTG